MFQDGPKGTISPALKCPLFTLKSKRLGANTYCSIRLGVQTGAFTSPQKSSHSPAEIHQTEMKLTCRARNTEEVHAAYSKPAYARQTPSSSPPQQSCTEDWFHSLPFQRFQERGAGRRKRVVLPPILSLLAQAFNLTTDHFYERGHAIILPFIII